MQFEMRFDLVRLREQLDAEYAEEDRMWLGQYVVVSCGFLKRGAPHR